MGGGIIGQVTSNCDIALDDYALITIHCIFRLSLKADYILRGGPSRFHLVVEPIVIGCGLSIPEEK
jgi:hypothetical protein